MRGEARAAFTGMVRGLDGSSRSLRAVANAERVFGWKLREVLGSQTAQPQVKEAGT